MLVLEARPRLRFVAELRDEFLWVAIALAFVAFLGGTAWLVYSRLMA